MKEKSNEYEPKGYDFLFDSESILSLISGEAVWRGPGERRLVRLRGRVRRLQNEMWPLWWRGSWWVVWVLAAGKRKSRRRSRGYQRYKLKWDWWLMIELAFIWTSGGQWPLYNLHSSSTFSLFVWCIFKFKNFHSVMIFNTKTSFSFNLIAGRPLRYLQLQKFMVAPLAMCVSCSLVLCVRLAVRSRLPWSRPWDL